MIVYKMVRGGQAVADVVTLPNGKCVVSWPNSTIVYDSEDAARDVHVDHMAGRGERTRFDVVSAPPDFIRGANDCAQDACENVPFASVGGLDKRDEMVAPEYEKPLLDKNMYLLGYAREARSMYGPDWRTCSFGWTPALTIGAPS